MPTDAEIASSAHLLPITEVAAKLGIPANALEMYGPYKAKLSRTFLHNLQERPSGKLAQPSLSLFACAVSRTAFNISSVMLCPSSRSDGPASSAPALNERPRA